ncbi:MULTISPECIES: NADH-dependent flavin oxidoreductase [Cohnella]|uniref:NADH-dependent flavin oxidoreductase n=1 Tax=Cohnella TaxID=329857 RepID=UPI0009BB0A1A|nr:MULTISPECIES: NADH-dependent flavin oxidoreductase [Cohnella]MBN2980238.1 NADH-dependent flavin oxidoreductase [Cohnella algarum]
MNQAYRPIFDSFAFKSGVRLKSRVVMAPMTHMSSNADGSISEEEIRYYSRRARSAGMVITAATYVSAEGGLFGGPGADRDELIPGLGKLAAAIRAKGAAAVLQIFHGGRQNSRTGEFVSSGTIPEDKEGAAIPRALAETEMDRIVRAYAEAAGRAVEAGFDGVEIHGGNGNLLQQFFSPYTNRRTDSFGGSLENRMKLALTVVDEVLRTVRGKAKKPFIVGFRLSPEEPETPGVTMADTLAFIDALSAAGLDYLHVSVKDFRSVPRRGVEDRRSRLAIIQERVGSRLAVIGVGSIHTPEDALEALRSGIPLIALGRELIMEPDWSELIRQGREEKIRTALSLKNREELCIPDPLLELLTSVPGWIPLDPDRVQA